MSMKSANLRFSGWGDSIGRIPQPDRTIYTLYDYRKRLATYRTDLDLLASHQNFAWIPVWDDHGMVPIAFTEARCVFGF